jgi:ribosomal protein L37AE/L43A
MPKHTVKPKKVYTLDLTEVVTRLCATLGLKRHLLVDVLNNTEIEGQKFKFVYDADTHFRVYVKCPKCRKKKMKLHKLEDEWACADCHHLARPVRREPKRGSTVYARYIRPLLKLKEINDKLFSEDLTLRQRQIYEKKAAKLRKVIPDYIFNIKDTILDAVAKLKKE